MVHSFTWHSVSAIHPVVAQEELVHFTADSYPFVWRTTFHLSSSQTMDTWIVACFWWWWIIILKSVCGHVFTSLGRYVRVENLVSRAESIISLFEKWLTCFPKWPHHFAFPQVMNYQCMSILIPPPPCQSLIWSIF